MSTTFPSTFEAGPGKAWKELQKALAATLDAHAALAEYRGQMTPALFDMCANSLDSLYNRTHEVQDVLARAEKVTHQVTNDLAEQADQDEAADTLNEELEYEAQLERRWNGGVL